MTPTQLEILHKEYEQKFADYTSYDDIDGYLTARGAMWQWFEYKLKAEEEKKPSTATEIMFLEEVRRIGNLNWLMAKALVKGRVNSRVLRYAEETYSANKDLYDEDYLKSNKLKNKDEIDIG